MSGKGNFYDNSMFEAFFRTLKFELVWRTVFYTTDKANYAVARYITGFYNPIRRRLSVKLPKPHPVRKNGG